MTRHDTQVLVVGAGPTGLMLAGQLARQGIATRIVDRAAHGCRQSRALTVHARALELLDRMGLAEPLTAAGQRVRAVNLWDGDRRLARVDFAALNSRFPFVLDVPQHETERILREHLHGHGLHVEQETELTDLRQVADTVLATVARPGRAPEPITVPYVVGCDGARSTVRRLLGVSFDGHPYGEDWLLADVTVDWSRPHDELHVIFNPSGRATVFMPLPGGRWRIVLYFAAELGGGDRSAGGATGGPPNLDEIRDLVARRVPGPVAVSDPTWLARFRTARRSAGAHRVGRGFLAGDAVHEHSPAGGQGLNTGLGDAVNLGWKLAAVLADGARPALLDTYEAERAPVGRQVVGLSHSLVRLAALTRPHERAARRLLVPAATSVPAVRARAARRLAQVDAGYRDGPLGGPAGSACRSAVRPGDRVPDAGGVGPDGAPVTLHQLLGGRHTLLNLEEGHRDRVPTWLGGHGCSVHVVDLRSATARRMLGPGPHLIRPDGHLARFRRTGGAGVPAALVRRHRAGSQSGHDGTSEKRRRERVTRLWNSGYSDTVGISVSPVSACEADVSPRLTRAERQGQTRSELVSAAAAVFRARGFHAASLEEIADAAGYSKGAVYSNFAGKDELFVAVLDARYAGIVRVHRERMSRAPSAAAALRAAAAQLAEEARTDPGWTPVMIEFWTYAARDERMRTEIAARHERQLDEIAALLGDVAERFGLRPSRPLREIARHGTALQRGIALERLLGSASGRGVFEDAFVNLVLGFFSPKEAQA